MFVSVAVGTRFVNEPATTEFPFARLDEQSLAPPPAFDRLSRWSAVALASVILAYAGPVREHLMQHVYTAAGMRTW